MQELEPNVDLLNYLWQSLCFGSVAAILGAKLFGRGPTPPKK